MKLVFYIARRYIYSRRSNKAVNLITRISMAGIVVSAMAMVILLSAFNGIEELVSKSFSKLDADLTIYPSQGNKFKSDAIDTLMLKELREIQSIHSVVEETAILKHESHWSEIMIKGVHQNYLDVHQFNQSTIIGEAKLDKQGQSFGVVGYGLFHRLEGRVNTFQGFETFHLYSINQKKKNKKDPFIQIPIPISGVFNINIEFDEKYLLIPIDLAQRSMNIEGYFTQLEIQLKDQSKIAELAEVLQEKLGDQFQIKTKFDKNALMYKTHQIEKLIMFLILAFIMAIACFNLIASLVMLILDKKRDIITLRALGFSMRKIKLIFLSQGLMINVLGGALGCFFGLLIVLAQKHFHLLKLQNAIVDYQPVAIKSMDIVWVLASIIFIGGTFSYLPAFYMKRISK